MVCVAGVEWRYLVCGEWWLLCVRAQGEKGSAFLPLDWAGLDKKK